MLVLPFRAAGERYGLPCIEVVEVLPALPVRKVPHAPAFVAGIFSYRGVVTPAFDLSVLLGGNKVESALSTRMAIVTCSAGKVALLAEDVSAPSELQLTDTASVKVADAPYLGDVVSVDGQILQIIYVEELVSAELRAMFFGGS